MNNQEKEGVFLTRCLAGFISFYQNAQNLDMMDFFVVKRDSKGKKIRHSFTDLSEHLGKMLINASVDYNILINRYKKNDLQEPFIELVEDIAKINDLICCYDRGQINNLLKMLVATKEDCVYHVKDEEEKHFEMFFALYKSSDDKNKFMTLMAGINC